MSDGSEFSSFFLTMIFYICYEILVGIWIFESNFRGDEKSIDFSMDFDFVSF